MIKTRISVVGLILSFAFATFSYGANAHSGKWKVNESKSKFSPGMGKTNTVQYSEKKYSLELTIDGVDQAGKQTHGVWMGKADGKVYKVKGNLSWDAMTYKMVDDHTFDM